MAITEKDMAPAFLLPSTTGKDISLKELKGKKVVLYFYPRDDTPGCTTEACNFRDGIAELERAGAVVLGVSPDITPAYPEPDHKYSGLQACGGNQRGPLAH